MHAFRWLVTLAVVAPLPVLFVPPLRSVEPGEASWGTIKGQVVWGVDQVPQQGFVINPKNKGVRWVIVSLVDPKDVKAKLPIHPALAQPKEKTVTLDSRQCVFEPHIVCLREGQNLEIKNLDRMPHNPKVDSPPGNPNPCQLVPPGKTLTIENWKASTFVSQVSCTIHPGMRGYVRVFAHPYFAVTDADGKFEIKDAPAGNWNIVMWQEETGFFLGNRDNKGAPIAIKANQTTDLGTFAFKPEP